MVDTVHAHAVTHLDLRGRPQGIGTAPTNLAISPDDATLYASDAGEDAVAAISLSQRPSARAGHGHRVYAPKLKNISRYRAKRATAARRLARTHGRARAAARRHYAKTLRSLTHRYLRPRTPKRCAGPSRRQERRYVERVLHALTVHKRRRRRALLKKAGKLLPAVVDCPRGFIPNLAPFKLIGRIPTAAYPDSVQTTPGGQLVWVAGKGFGSGPNPTYYFGGARTPYQTPPNAYGTYVLDLLIGRVGRLPLPTDRQVVADTAAADAQSRPYNSESQPPGSPIPATTGHPSAQIKHVFYIVRENRTYDQVFGSDPRGDGNPKLELFDDNGVSGPTGGITPTRTRWHASSRCWTTSTRIPRYRSTAISSRPAPTRPTTSRRRPRPTTPTGAAPMTSASTR